MLYAKERYSGMFIFVGPLLLLLTTIFEWIMGNFFPMMVCSLFAVFWLSFGFLQLPTLQLAAAYSSSGTNAAEGAASVQYNAALALYLTVWGFALFTFFIFTLKTNLVFALIFAFVTIASWVLAGAYWKVASGEYVTAGHLQKVCSFSELIFSAYVRSTDHSTGWRCSIVCGGMSGVVHDVRDDGCRNATCHQSSSRRSEPFLAQNRC
jgi:succinate-acetate transporter protein